MLELELIDVRTRFDNSEKDSKVLSTQLTDIQAAYATDKQSLQSTVTSLTKKLDIVVKKSSAEVEELSLRLNTSQQLISSFEEQLSTTMEKLETKSAEVLKLKSDMDCLKNMSSDVSEKVIAMESRKTELETQTIASQIEITTLRAEEKKLKEEILKHVEEFKVYEQQVNDSMVSKDHMQRSISEAVDNAKEEWYEENKIHKGVLDALQSELQDSRKDLFMAKSQMEEDSNELRNLKDVISRAQATGQKLEHQILSLTESHSLAKSKLEAEKNDVITHMNAYKDELKNVQSSYHDVKIKYQGKYDEVSNLEGQLSAMKGDLIQSQSEYKRIRDIHSKY